MTNEEKEKILKGKDVGIRFICKKHFYLSNILPCKKCVEELGLKMPDPLPLGQKYKNEIEELYKVFDGKVKQK
mgnify:FL=1|jgi:hypothetical protein